MSRNGGIEHPEPIKLPAAMNFKGDNLLIARVNMLMSFEEYIQERWTRKPTIDEYKKISNIIAWNMWQIRCALICVVFPARFPASLWPMAMEI